MGIIYKLTCRKTGKSYIGQTIKTLSERWQKHVQKALRNDKTPQCWALNNAIRKYGAEEFDKEVLWEGPDEDLNEEEEIWICFEETLVPLGYNLTEGGNHRIQHHREDSKDKMSDSRRTYCDYDLPRNVVEIHNDKLKEHGFRVITPTGSHNFLSMNMSMEEKYDLAMECFETIQSGQPYVRKNKHKRGNDELTIPTYIVRRGENGFAVNKPGFPRKTFAHVNCTREENLQNAIQHLNTLK